MYQKDEFKPGLLLVAISLTVVSLVVRPSPYRWTLFIPISSICLYLAFFTTSMGIVSDYFVTFALFSLIFTSLDLTFLTDVQNELRLVGQMMPISTASLSTRFWWALRLLSSPRGIGWAHEPTTHIPPHPNKSRGRFLWNQLLWTAKDIIILDVIRVLSFFNPYFQKGGPSLIEAGLLWRLTVFMHVGTLYLGFNAIYSVYSVVSVGLGLTAPEDWPPLFGCLMDGYTVRRSCGRVWHQMLRRFLKIESDFIAYKVARLPRKSAITTYFKLFVAFFISGLIHYAGDCAALGHRSGGGLTFFIYQPAAITFEDAVIAVASNFGFTKLTPMKKVVGYIWVATWFTYSLPVWSAPLLTAGFMSDAQHTVSFSPIMGLSYGEWFPKPDSVNILSTALTKIFHTTLGEIPMVDHLTSVILEPMFRLLPL